MLRIDLLPPGIRQARLARKLIVPVAGVFVILAIVVFLYSGQLALQRRAAEEAAAKAEADVEEQQSELSRLASEAQQYRDRVAPALRVADFCRQFETFNSRWADVVEAIARYTWEEATLSNISVTSDTVTLMATARDAEALARFLFNFERCRMPSEGGGTEPLWSKDSVSVKDLEPVFSGPISIAASLGGFSSEGIGWTGGGGAAPTAPMGAPTAPAFGGAPAMAQPPGAPGMPPMGMPTGGPPGLGAGPAGGGGAGVQYRGGLLYVSPISVTVAATLAKPITLQPLGGAAPAAAAPMAGVPGMGVPGMGGPTMGPPGMRGAPGMGGPPGAPVGAGGAPTKTGG